jgi:hypothetical protein
LCIKLKRKDKIKDLVLEITDEIVKNELANEYSIFKYSMSDVYDEIAKNKDKSTLSQSAFGDSADLLSTIILVLITTYVGEISKESIKFSKQAFKIWFNKNKKDLLEKGYINQKIIDIMNSYFKAK